MRIVFLAAVIAALLMAACTNAPSPTATLVPPTAEPPTNAPPVGQGENPLPDLPTDIFVPVPGTLIIPDQLTPNAPTAEPITIDRLSYTQTGGITGATTTIILTGDGALTRNGQSSTVTQDDLHKIAALLDGIHFFDLQGIFTGPSSAADTYRYTLTVDSGSRSRTVTSQDGMTPPELHQVYNAIINLPTS